MGLINGFSWGYFKVVNNAVIILSVDTVEEERDLLSLLEVWQCQYFSYKKIFNVRFRYISKLLDVFFFFLFVLKHSRGRKSIVLGAPCLRNRLVAKLLRCKYIAYLRGLHIGGDTLTSLSDKVWFWSKKIGMNSNLLNPYSADVHLVSSQLTAKFLGYRKASNQIVDVGALWLRGCEISSDGEGVRKVYFLTQAFSEHQNMDAQREQKEFLSRLGCLLSQRGVELIIKKHPRDYDVYENFHIYEGDATDLTRTISTNDIVISFFSTLGFELSTIGADVKFISLPALSNVYNTPFEVCGVYYQLIDLQSFDIEFVFSEKRQYLLFSKPQYVSKDDIF